MTFDAILVIPKGALGQAALTARLGGMPAVTRQLRLLATSGARRILVIHDLDGNRAELANAISHRLAPKNIKIKQHALSSEPCIFQDELAPELFILPAQNVLDHKCFATRRSFWSSNGELLLWFGPAARASSVIEALVAGWSPSRVTDDGGILPKGWLAIQGVSPSAERMLWDSCRKKIDGVISTHINRHISLAISRLLAPSPVTPNQVTLFSIAVGLVGAASVAQGGYVMTLMGAFLLQVASILDGVDGELARVRVQFSLIGEWLDTVGDDLVNVTFILALGVARWSSDGMDEWALLAFYVAAAMALVAAIYYLWIFRTGRGDILSVDWFERSIETSGNWRERVFAWGAKLFRRDALIALILVASLSGVTHWALVPIALAATATLAAQFVKMVRRE